MPSLSRSLYKSLSQPGALGIPLELDQEGLEQTHLRALADDWLEDLCDRGFGDAVSPIIPTDANGSGKETGTVDPGAGISLPSVTEILSRLNTPTARPAAAWMLSPNAYRETRPSGTQLEYGPRLAERIRYASIRYTGPGAAIEVVAPGPTARRFRDPVAALGFLDRSLESMPVDTKQRVTNFESSKAIAFLVETGLRRQAAPRASFPSDTASRRSRRTTTSRVIANPGRMRPISYWSEQ